MSTIKNWNFFWENRKDFQLGHIPTEQPNIKTQGLAEVAQSSLSTALDMLIEVDSDALQHALKYSQKNKHLEKSIHKVLNDNGRVFIAGCGATGRLALTVEKLWRDIAPDNIKDNVIGIIAGGDAAIIKSIEGFEDHSQYAIRHLQELNFNKNDLLIGVSEGGETPFVLSCINYAKSITIHKPCLVHCNPTTSLLTVERAKKIILSRDIDTMSLYIGNMALAGSTRMQASTILCLAIGINIINFIKPIEYNDEIRLILKTLKKIDKKQFIKLIKSEYGAYKNNGLITYQTCKNLGITVLTDTTERTPTFNTRAFENMNDILKKPSLCSLRITNTLNSTEAWHHLLSHPPRTIEWQHCNIKTGIERLYGYDISDQGYRLRCQNFPNYQHHPFKISHDDEKNILKLALLQNNLNIPTDGLSTLSIHMLLKCILNMHSTLVMGLLEKYHSNIMTFVIPGNNKLIDRAIRHSCTLLNQKNITCDYDHVAKTLYYVSKTLLPEESIVLKTVEHFQKNVTRDSI